MRVVRCCVVALRWRRCCCCVRVACCCCLCCVRFRRGRFGGCGPSRLPAVSERDIPSARRPGCAAFLRDPASARPFAKRRRLTGVQAPHPRMNQPDCLPWEEPLALRTKDNDRSMDRRWWWRFHAWGSGLKGGIELISGDKQIGFRALYAAAQKGAVLAWAGADQFACYHLKRRVPSHFQTKKAHFRERR